MAKKDKTQRAKAKAVTPTAATLPPAGIPKDALGQFLADTAGTLKSFDEIDLQLARLAFGDRKVSRPVLEAVAQQLSQARRAASNNSAKQSRDDSDSEVARDFVTQCRIGQFGRSQFTALPKNQLHAVARVLERHGYL